MSIQRLSYLCGCYPPIMRDFSFLEYQSGVCATACRANLQLCKHVWFDARINCKNYLGKAISNNSLLIITLSGFVSNQ